jgi:hypothetical protein
VPDLKRSDTARLRESLKTLQERLDILLRDAKAIRESVDDLSRRNRVGYLRDLLKRLRFAR